MRRRPSMAPRSTAIPAMPNRPDPARQRIKLHPKRHPLELIGLFILLLLVALGIGIRLLLLGGVGPV